MKSVKTIAVRLDKKTLKLLERFIVLNPFFDTSTVVRLSLDHFLNNPLVNLKSIGAKNVK